MSRGVKAHAVQGLLDEAAVQGLLDEARAMSGDFDSLSEAVAKRVGVNPGDLLAMDLISRKDGVTAGQLADHLQLTSGAITGLIDRLERAGYARRATDRNDRRRVLVVRTSKEQRIAELYIPLAVELRRSAERYSKTDLALLTDFLRELRSVVRKSADRIHPKPA
jgi:DNA-binding MarR family transcriptional regulator